MGKEIIVVQVTPWFDPVAHLFDINSVVGISMKLLHHGVRRDIGILSKDHAKSNWNTLKALVGAIFSGIREAVPNHNR
jgi:hypothetical protein